MKTLYEDYNIFEKIANNYIESGTLNLSDYECLKPTTLLPLICFSNNNVKDEDFLKSLFHEFDKSSYNIDLPTYLKGVEKEKFLEKIIEKINYSDYGGLHSIFFISNELITNVYNHTPFDEGLATQAYISIKEYRNNKLLDFSIMDDGLSIPGNFEKHNFDFTDDCDAISKAVNQVSTEKDKNIPIKYSRGLGLWSTLRLAIEGNGGSALLVSRNGCLSINSKDNYKYYNLNNTNIFKGTLVSLRFRRNQIQNFYDLLEINKGNTYNYLE